ncbi:hypothetical protein R70006_03170 [Paraburkholderia domus]|uniref:DUF1302 domain-containing protein n=1 Tax=Paraburkholderia domus TaxID=2793075 RepID=UPI001913B984|nr:DUF1302 domain-containing protein [Paraburkholderia domus]MBK5050483.1 DUF1302 domain-containing protein [Burkholderia sp. R-70006]CAE6754101.1 hypothetical protein R70006_03170 [Paraburkholderia domus]
MARLATKVLASIVCASACSVAHAYEFDTGIGDMHASWVSNLTGGMGIRTKNPSCSLTGDPNAEGCGAAANTAQWSNGDDGDLNYKKGKPFTTSLSLTSELLLTMPSEGYKFMIRGTAMYDFMADNTERTELSEAAKNQIVRSAQLLDLWIEKDFTINDQTAHVRIGNQVINWGESYFASGGINATNSLDIQKLLVPGTQLKQAILPAPMISFATGLPAGLSTEAYYQAQWNGNKFPPVGSYWSVTDTFGRGAQPFSLNTNNFNVSGTDAATIAGSGAKNIPFLNGINQGLVNGAYTGAPYNALGSPANVYLPGNRPEFGIKLGYKPSFLDASFAFYYENYTDKSPVLTYLSNGTSRWDYLTNRQLFGLSSNFSLGDWAIGTELSYRPHDAVSLSGCYLPGGPADANTNGATGVNCPAYMDNKKLQFDINAQLNLTRSTYPILRFIKADMAIFTAELTWIKYPGLNPNAEYFRTVNGESVYQVAAAGYFQWLNNNSGLGYPIAQGQGTSNSVGLTLDFNWTYDGTLIPGWQVTPGVTFYDALSGYTPTLQANYMQGAKSINAYVLFNQNPTTWQGGINFTAFFGGNSLSQPYGDRNFVGIFVTRNF